MVFGSSIENQRSTPKNLIEGSDGVELGGGNGGHLPLEYNSVVATEVGSLRSERTAVNRLGDQEGAHNPLERVRWENQAANVGYLSPVSPVERGSSRAW